MGWKEGAFLKPKAHPHVRQSNGRDAFVCNTHSGWLFVTILCKRRCRIAICIGTSDLKAHIYKHRVKAVGQAAITVSGPPGCWKWAEWLGIFQPFRHPGLINNSAVIQGLGGYKDWCSQFTICLCEHQSYSYPTSPRTRRSPEDILTSVRPKE